MARDATWTNGDGLVVGFGGRDTNNYEAGSVCTKGKVNQLEVVLDWDNLPGNGAVQGKEIGIPANSIIQSATFVVETAFTSGGATTLSIGLQEADGTVIDADGIDATVAKTAIDAVGEAVQCDGALVAGTATVGTADAYVYTTVASGPYTAGKGTLTIEYILP